MANKPLKFTNYDYRFLKAWYKFCLSCSYVCDMRRLFTSQITILQWGNGMKLFIFTKSCCVRFEIGTAPNFMKFHLKKECIFTYADLKTMASATRKNKKRLLNTLFILIFNANTFSLLDWISIEYMIGVSQNVKKKKKKNSGKNVINFMMNTNT